MAPTKKSIYRQPGAQHFQLVHRSLRDPLSIDPDANQRVLKAVERSNERKGANTLADLEATYKDKVRENEGEAALYGITYDDSSYDYMAHLRPVGQGGAADSFMIPAPRGSGVAAGMKSYKGKGKATAEDLFGPMTAGGSGGPADLPASVLPSDKELSLEAVYARAQDIPSELEGFQPDMDPHVRQVLEALSDEEFEDYGEEDEDDGGDFFAELVKGGERAYPDEVEYDFEEWGIDDRGNKLAGPSSRPKAGLAAGQTEAGPSGTLEEDENDEGEEEGETWERFKAFKQQQEQRRAVPPAISDFGEDEERSEMADTVGSLNTALRDMMVVGGKKRRGKRGPSDASGMSMSSSTMFRNKGLSELDDRFDKIERDYAIDEEDEDEAYLSGDDTASIAPSLMSNMSSMSKMSLFSTASAAPPEVSREDFDAILDDFLENYEIVGRKYKQSLGATHLSGPEKLAVLRAAVDGEGGEGIGKEENRRRILELEKMERDLNLPGRNKGRRLEKMERVKREEDEGEKWDVESILSTYTNTDNHPGRIRARTAAEEKKRAEMRRAKAVAMAEAEAAAAAAAAANREDDGSESSGSETEREGPKVTVSRPKGETAEERRARKAGVKAQRQARRVEKKSHQETFDKERKRQIKTQTKRVSDGRAADLSVVSRQVMSLS